MLEPSKLDYQLPDFAAISFAHVRPAFDEALRRHDAEVAAIAAADPSWENTVEALERSGRDLERVVSYFANLLGTDSTPEMQELAGELFPELSAHFDAVYQNDELYTRLKAVTAPEDPESQRLLDYLLRSFARRGADLDAAGKEELTRLNQRLSALSEEFGRHLLDDTKRLAVGFDSAEQLRGLPEERVAAARDYAAQAGRTGFVLPLELPTQQAEQARLADPASRLKLWKASQQRGAESNGAVLTEMVRLRARRAELLGYATHADYVIAEETAGTADAARQLLADLAPAAAANAAAEGKLLSEEAGFHDADFGPADWPYWQSRVRERDYALDEEELRKYFPLNRVLSDGVFQAAHMLYGVTVHPRPDLVGYAPDVDVWEVVDADGTGLGLLLTDYFTRPSKRGGAWMSTFVEQSRLLGTRPVVVNVMNLSKPPAGQPVLLSQDELHTVFHEFGHALHGLLSDVRYPTFSGTNVPRDWVEFPSQINENWALDPRLVKAYAFHVDTGEPIPDKTLEALGRAREFGQGFATVEYLAAAVIDLAWHSLPAAEAEKLVATPEAIADFEQEALAKVGLDETGIAPRYRSTYFNHIFAGGYSAGYYSYLWAEALDADGFELFRDAESLRQAGQAFREQILSAGASRDFTDAFRQWRGHDKDIRPLLVRRGLAGSR
ncbi:MAG: M3 family metallopeptidase [Mycobacteriaceae bacterium]|nr:M3 family metallopeptidase [Mycobacteriaceae bacterium]MDY5829393.1 M3 family metallopeptidase [Corynebacterium sp.]